MQQGKVDTNNYYQVWWAQIYDKKTWLRDYINCLEQGKKKG